MNASLLTRSIRHRRGALKLAPLHRSRGYRLRMTAADARAGAVAVFGKTYCLDLDTGDAMRRLPVFDTYGRHVVGHRYA